MQQFSSKGKFMVAILLPSLINGEIFEVSRRSFDSQDLIRIKVKKGSKRLEMMSILVSNSLVNKKNFVGRKFIRKSHHNLLKWIIKSFLSQIRINYFVDKKLLTTLMRNFFALGTFWQKCQQIWEKIFTIFIKDQGKWL